MNTELLRALTAIEFNFTACKQHPTEWFSWTKGKYEKWYYSRDRKMKIQPQSFFVPSLASLGV